MSPDLLQIIQGDSAQVLAGMEEGSVNMVCTSPPYDQLRTYDGHNRWDFEAIARQLYRVMCSGGVVCWNVGDSVVDGSETLTSAKQKIFFREQCGFRIHDTMIYEKVAFTNPSHNRYHQVFEYVFILSKSAPGVFNPIKDKRNSTAGSKAFGTPSFRQADQSMKPRKNNVEMLEFGMRGNVWKGNASTQESPGSGSIHPAMMPEWLARDLILSWSNPGDTILDPFLGSGTTAMVALELGRKAIGIELNPDYCALARQRCNVTPGFVM